ncbi:MAG: PTS sugar transporter subunit IIA, partial [Chloroflexi bacterium]|nr:PTS sugar transporter subunit IIA [Chloroflexota bacterium]
PLYARTEIADEPFNPFVGATHEDLFRLSIETDPEILTLRNEVRNAEVQLDLARRGQWDVALLLGGESALEGRGESDTISDWSVNVGFEVSLVDPRVTGSLIRQSQANILRFSEAIAAREKSAGTGMEQGVALPHGSSDRVENVFGALGISRKGIDFDSLDGLPAKIVLLLVLPRRDFHVHVRTLAGISHLLNEASFRKSLENAKSPDAILKLIRTEEHSSVFDRLRWRKG